MKSFTAYEQRQVRFLELMTVGDWHIKLYSITSKKETLSETYIEKVKKELPTWLSLSETNFLEKYHIGTLLLHECKEGCFAVINWWVDENMLQHYVFLAQGESDSFHLYSTNGIVTCVWELAVIGFERNAWVKHVLLKNNEPDFTSYLNERLNAIV